MDAKPDQKINISKQGFVVPRALTIRRRDFNLALLGKVIVVFVFLGPILVPLLWLTNIPFFQTIARAGWAFGESFCTYTDKSFTIGGIPMMVCARCFGVACGILFTGLTYFYTPFLRKYLPKRKLYLAAGLAALFVPWLSDSGLERLHLWVTDYWLMVPTGMLGGVAVTLAPLIFWPRPKTVKTSLSNTTALSQPTSATTSEKKILVGTL